MIINVVKIVTAAIRYRKREIGRHTVSIIVQKRHAAIQCRAQDQPVNHEGLKIHSINSFTSAKMVTALSLRQRKSTTTPKLQASVLKNRRMSISLSCFRMIVNIPALLNDFTK
ncbi:hypothetical protein ALC57_09399 [Trachymyrmex cornetzi]|uniref:Uncharacterized protein n=1 Tax=Trachymyrmex cornetzi TaxID=471704 RepID=A0A195E017_9HYME|nr:hypothetical protein ALC57_09399 [Trachymyrmex cornetzi]